MASGRSFARIVAVALALGGAAGAGLGRQAGAGLTADERRQVTDAIDGVLGGAEDGISSLRRRLQSSVDRATPSDAAIAGAVAGFACGKLIVGNPTTLGIVGGASFAYAQAGRPLPPQLEPLRGAARRSSLVVSKLRRG